MLTLYSADLTTHIAGQASASVISSAVSKLCLVFRHKHFRYRLLEEMAQLYVLVQVAPSELWLAATDSLSKASVCAALLPVDSAHWLVFVVPQTGWTTTGKMQRRTGH